MRVRSVLVVIGAALLAGCQPKLMPTPIVFLDDGPDPYVDTPAEDLSPTARIFYATDRNPTKSSDPAKRYGNERGLILRLGTADVAFGKPGATWQQVHDETLDGERPVMRLGAVEEIGPLWTTVPTADDGAIDRIWDPDLRDDPAREPAYAFADAINDKLARSWWKDIVILVPGINTNFSMPCMLAAGFTHYMGRQGVMIAYCWPSAGDFLKYGRDTETVNLTTDGLRKLLVFLAEETDVQRIHLIGYSRGAAVMNGALHQLRLMHVNEPRESIVHKTKIGSVIYAGPDADLLALRTLKLDRVGDVTELVVLYFSPKDFALQLSSMFGSGTQRMGRPGEGLSGEDLEDLRHEVFSAMIDVSTAQKHAGAGAHGHTFWYDNPWVSSDLIAAMAVRLPPAERGLIRGADGAMWVFPDDYPQRVREVIAAVDREDRDP